jgi:hypothetical protein
VEPDQSGEVVPDAPRLHRSHPINARKGFTHEGTTPIAAAIATMGTISGHGRVHADGRASALTRSK